MHWAVQSKKDQMLEAPDLNNSNNITNEIWTQQTENSEDGLSDGNREQEDVAIPDVKPQSSKNTDSPSKWNQQLQKIAVSRDWAEMEAFSHEKFFSKIICLAGSFFNVVLGWGFVLDFVVYYLFNFEAFRPFFLPTPCLLACLLVKPKTGEEEEKKVPLKPKWFAAISKFLKKAITFSNNFKKC